MSGKRSGSEFAENSREVSMDELREFLEADLVGATADPKFKEELRQTLWDLLQSRTDRVDIGDDGG
jgi:hypothetical protein